MTGRTDRIIQSGRVPDRRNASIRRSRLIAFLRRWPDVVRTSTWSDRESSSRSIRWMMSRTASAPMPAWKIRPPRAPLPYLASRSRKFQPSSEVSGRVISGWSLSISSRARRISSLSPSASRRSCSRSASSSASMRSSASAIRWAVAASSSASRRLRSSPIRSDLGRGDLAQLGGGGLAGLVAGGQHDLARRSEGDRLLGRGRAERLELGLDALGRLGDRVGRLGALALEVGLGRGERLVQLVLLLVEDGAQLVLTLGEGLAALAAAALGLLVELAQARGRAPPRRRG